MVVYRAVRFVGDCRSVAGVVRVSATDAVIRAVSRGAASVEDIATKAGITPSHARTCLTRLRTKGYVRSINVKHGKRGRLCEYEPIGVKCILADVWR